jgi:acetyl esterase/lipase
MRHAILCILLVGWQERKAPDDVLFEKDIVFGRGADEELKLNLARPKAQEGRLPGVVFIHGGAWRAGSRAIHDPMTWRAAQKGYVSATVSYRFCPKHPFPAQVEDVKCAVRFLRANAEKYGIDPDRIGAVGFSAGAHLSMMLGTMAKEDGLEGDGGHADQPSRVQAVVSFFGPTQLWAKDIPEQSRPLVRDFIGGTVEEKEELYRKASPVTYVSKGDAPMLLFQGTKDPLVPHTQAVAMADAMTAAGVAGRVELIAGAGHGWGGAESARTEEATYAFLDQHLKRRK